MGSLGLLELPLSMSIECKALQFCPFVSVLVLGPELF